WIFVTGAFAPNRNGWRWFAILGLTFAAVWLGLQDNVFQPLLSGLHPAETLGPVTRDSLGYLACWGAIWVGVLLVLQASGPDYAGPTREWASCLLLIIAGLMLCGHANNLVLLFLALEMISIPTYVLIFLSRAEVSAREATVKYFFLSILSSALTLYGFSFLYG